MGTENIKIDTIDERIDQFEALVRNCPLVDCPLVHKFADGMYIREIFMKKDIYVTSLVHDTTHPFFIMKGKVSVISENDGEQILEAPYIGITTPNTRRILYIHKDTVWITCHATSIKPKDDTEESILEAVKLIGQQIIEPRENPLLGGRYINNVFEPHKYITH